jgi:VanZ family protein
MTLGLRIALYRMACLTALIAITYLAVTGDPPAAIEGVNDKSGHLLAFYVLALLTDFSFPYSRYRIHKIVPLVGYGLLLEITQYYLPGRSFSLLDMIADAAGLFLYRLSLPFLRRIPLMRWRWAVIRE